MEKKVPSDNLIEYLIILSFLNFQVYVYFMFPLGGSVTILMEEADLSFYSKCRFPL